MFLFGSNLSWPQIPKLFGCSGLGPADYAGYLLLMMRGTGSSIIWDLLPMVPEEMHGQVARSKAMGGSSFRAPELSLVLGVMIPTFWFHADQVALFLFDLKALRFLFSFFNGTMGLMAVDIWQL